MIMKRLALLLFVLVCSSCSWQEWKTAVVQYIPLTQGIRDVVEDLGGDPTRAAYAIGVADGSGTIAIDEQQFNLLPGAAWWHEHEAMHIAYDKAGSPFGEGPVELEHWANCGAELVTGEDPPFTAPGGYDDCSDWDVARLRYALTERLGVTFNG